MLEDFFTSKSRAKIIEFLLAQPGKEFYVRELTRLIHSNPRSVHLELRRLKDIGILKSRKSGTSLYFQANPDFLFYDELRSMVDKNNDMGVN